MSRHRDRRRSLAIMAAVSALLLPEIPLLHYLTYPLNLMVTAVHEMSHALAALVTGGTVISIDVFGDTSGVTMTAGGNRFLISSAGYLGSTVFGCLLLVAAQRARWHRAIIVVLMAYFGAFTLLARSGLAILIGVGVLGALWLAKRSKAGDDARFFVLDFIAFSSCLYAFHDVWVMFAITAGISRGTGPTDAQLLADSTHVPAMVWAIGWSIFSAAVAALSVRAAWRLTAPPQPKPD